MDRPTLEAQIGVSKMTRDELMELLLLHTPLKWISFWLHNHCLIVWRIIYWNWFDIWEGSENADKYRSWDIKIKRRLFGGNRG